MGFEDEVRLRIQQRIEAEDRVRTREVEERVARHRVMVEGAGRITEAADLLTANGIPMGPDTTRDRCDAYTRPVALPPGWDLDLDGVRVRLTIDGRLLQPIDELIAKPWPFSRVRRQHRLDDLMNGGGWRWVYVRRSGREEREFELAFNEPGSWADRTTAFDPWLVCEVAKLLQKHEA